MRSIDADPETITFLGLLRPQNEYFWTVAIIYHNLQRIYSLITLIYTTLNLGNYKHLDR